MWWFRINFWESRDDGKMFEQTKTVLKPKGLVIIHWADLHFLYRHILLKFSMWWLPEILKKALNGNCILYLFILPKSLQYIYDFIISIFMNVLMSIIFASLLPLFEFYYLAHVLKHEIDIIPIFTLKFARWVYGDFSGWNFWIFQISSRHLHTHSLDTYSF